MTQKTRVYPDSLSLTWKHVENQYKGKMMHLGLLTIHNHSQVPLPRDGWALYFNRFRRLVVDELPDVLTGHHINGDFYMLEPKSSFAPIPPRGKVVLPIVASHWVVTYTDLPTGNYFVFKYPDGHEEYLPVSLNYEPMDTSRIQRTSYDKLPVENHRIRYHRNEQQILSDVDPIDGHKPLITPTPNEILWQDSLVTLTGPVTVLADQGLENEKAYLETVLKKLLRPVNPEAEGAKITLSLTPETAQPESYMLTWTSDNEISISGSDAAGVFYGIQTLRGLFPPHAEKEGVTELTLQSVVISDKPRFGYRGMHVDVSRSFRSLKEMKKFLEIMSFYKLNTLHFHLTDDEGWRIEIPGLPELTEIGAFRGHTYNEKEHLFPSLGSGPYADNPTSNGNGFYSREEYIELLKYAKDHHIKVIPEVDLPGHSHAAVQSMIVRYERLMAQGDSAAAMEFYLIDPDDSSAVESVQKWSNNVVNVCMESTYRFCEKVFDELIAMYDEAGVPLQIIHIGGDEVPHGSWEGSPKCRKFLEEHPEYEKANDLSRYFVVRLYDMLKEKGIQTAGWEEIASKIEKNRRVPDMQMKERELISYIWNSVWGWGAEDLSYRLVNEGFPVVLANVTNYYFDSAYNKDPDERGLYWGAFVDTRNAWEFTPCDIRNCAEKNLYGEKIDLTRYENFEPLNPEGKENILGIQGCLWSENLRDMDKFEYMAFPKLLGLSERAWSSMPEWELEKDEESRQKDWTVFVHKTGHYELPRLDAWNVNYRIPLPGWIVERDTLYANIRFPGLTLRYTTDGTKPDTDALVYTKPVPVKGEVKMAAFTSDNNRRSR
ncbi:MAG: carbohydate-binding domain-containing protein [Candidatus Marinimicrobia bacterium]|nr:carbohydate-binding domain-containing protein [Candidatus Neomarinimicrobiota bacterium]